MTTNPFETPRTDLSPVAHDVSASDNAWSDGPLLVIRRVGARLPDVCIKTGRPAGARMTREVSWYPQWVYAMLLLNALIFLIVAMVTRKRASVEFALSEDARERRKKHILIGVALMILGVAGFFGAGIHPAFILVGLVVLLTGIFWALIGARLLWATKMNDTHAWLKGANPELLAALPPWRGF